MKGLIRIYILMVSVTAFLLWQGCDRSRDDMTQPDSDCITLNVDIPFAGTRAGSDGLNEFTVKSLHLFFYAAEGHDDDTSAAIYDVTIDGEFVYSRHITLALPDNALKDGGLFGPASDRCYVYAVANVDESRLTSGTVSGLKATIVDSDFDKTRVQDSFAMDGFAELSLNRADRIVSGTVTLQRAAAKLTLSVDLPQSIDVTNEIKDPLTGTSTTQTITYTSMPDQMRVWISNGVKTSVLNTGPVSPDNNTLYSNSISISQGSAFSFHDEQPKYKYVQDVPLYSYPSKWNPYSPDANCFLTLSIPWQYTDSQGQKQNVVTYYRLNVQPGKNMMERNTHYDMRVTIERLGGTVIQKPVDMQFDWNYNMEWNTQTLSTDIKEIRYLLLNSNDFSERLNAYTYVMENETEISVPYNSSHPVEIESVELTWHDFYNDRDRSITLNYNSGTYSYNNLTDYRPASDFAGIELDPANEVLKLKRNLLHIAWDGNRAAIRNGEGALNAYTFTIRVRHTDAKTGDAASHATIIITQIPAISITSQLTTSGNSRFVNNNNTTRWENTGSGWRPNYVYYGYVSSSTSTSNYYLGSVHDDDNVKNRNTYILTISKFDTGDNYIIADPRKRSVDNLNESGTSATATGEWTVQDNADRRMQNYYPADDNSNKSRYMAPALRIASQWGVTYNVTRRGAQRRCASYQENGRPAGRWRLPTIAEIEYICRLSNRKYIPYLFGTEGNTAYYWCATGGVNVNNSTTNPSVNSATTGSNDTRAVRCVYDEWYWGSDTLTNKNRFTWGDRARTVTGN